MWTKLGFGKYKGKTLPRIVFMDPDYFFWAHEEKMFTGPIAPEANRIAFRATRIRIPQRTRGRLVAVYRLHRPTGTFGGLELIPESQACDDDEPSFRPLRNDVIDLSVPHQIKRYDKSGEALLIRNVKFYLFGSGRARLTSAKCEGFFEDDRNFVLSTW